MNPSGQVAIVTGGGSGLGEATARALAARGAKVAMLDVGLARAEQVAAELGGIALQCDVSSADERRGSRRRGGKAARRAAHPGQLRRHRDRAEDHRQGRRRTRSTCSAR